MKHCSHLKSFDPSGDFCAGSLPMAKMKRFSMVEDGPPIPKDITQEDMLLVLRLL
jgi:hypothetical protein